MLAIFCLRSASTLRVDGEPILLDGVGDSDLLPAFGDEETGVSDLSAHLSVERSTVEDKLEHLLVFLLHRPLPEESGPFDREVVIAHEFLFARIVFDPVAEFIGGGVAGSLLLLEEFGIETVHVDGVTVLAGDQFGEVDRESVGVVEDEGVVA